MSNARQHGALHGASGRVEIDWTQIDDRLRLSRREYVPRKVTAPASEGVGLKLVKGVVQQQIGGDVDLEWRSSGLQIEFELPLHERQAAREGQP
jgi:two-component sensor histidine kinase